MNDLCHCGKELHYSCQKTKEFVESLIKILGRFVDITCDNITYEVDRHYVALHGIIGKDLPSLGFKKKENKK